MPSIAIFALRRKRAHLAGELDKAMAAIERQRETLANLDAVIRLFEPQSNPELIPAIRPSTRRGLFFRRGEQPRLCINALREAGRPISADQVAEHAMQAKGLENVEARVAAQVRESVHQALFRLERKGSVKRIIRRRMYGGNLLSSKQLAFQIVALSYNDRRDHTPQNFS